MDWGPVLTVVGLLGACLVALLLVVIARREADHVRRQATEDVQSIRESAQARQVDLERREARLAEREEGLAEEHDRLEVLQASLRERSEQVASAERTASRTVDAAERAAARTTADAERSAALRIRDAKEAARAELESVGGLTQEEARAELVARMTEEARTDAAAHVRRVESQARRSADARARRILVTAVQRLAVPTSAAAAITVLPLPSDEMTGRIIGKEGRNIRAFEALTGVNVLVDDRPDAVVLSCFDPERREVAAATLQALMDDGRINPQRIEVVHAEAVAAAGERTEAAGEDAVERAGVERLAPELVTTLGRLRLRTSYGQSVLDHLVECAQTAAAIAAEVGADVQVARRAALLHDIGKALTPEQSGTHAALGADLARRCGESATVVNAIAAHHDEVPTETVEAVIVQIADAISAARPGARRDDLDQYVERMERLESLVASQQGVRRVLAMAAGREVRVVVEPSEVTDDELEPLARAIARQIESDLSYPGEVRVTVVRELHASATAS
jgi:ribonuclease Y